MANIFFDNQTTYSSDDFAQNKDCQRLQIRAENDGTNQFDYGSFATKKVPFTAANLTYEQNVWDLLGVDRLTARFLCVSIQNPDPQEFGVNDVYIRLLLADSGATNQIEFNSATFSVLNAEPSAGALPDVTLRQIIIPVDKTAILTIQAG